LTGGPRRRCRGRRADRLRDGESTRLSVDIVDIGDIHELDGVPILGGDLREGEAEGSEAGVDVIGDSVLVVEGLVDELDGEHGRVA